MSAHRLSALAVVYGLSLVITPSAFGQPNWLDAGRATEATEEAPSTASPANEAVNLESRLLQWRARSEKFQSAWHEAGEQLDQLEERIAEARAIPLLPLADLQESSVSALEQRLRVSEQELKLARQHLTELQGTLVQMLERRKELPQLLATARVQVQNLQRHAATAAADSEDDQSADQLQLQVALAEVRAHESEMLSHDARTELLNARIELASLSTDKAAQQVDQLRAAVREAKRRQMHEEAERAREHMAESQKWPPKLQNIVQQVAEQNTALAEAWAGKEGLVEKSATVSERLARARAQVAAVEAEFERIAAQVDAAGLSDSVGALLRRQRAEAPDVGMYQRFVRMRKERLRAAHLEQIQLRQRRDSLEDVDSRIDELLSEVGGQLGTAAQEQQVHKLLRELLLGQRRYLDALIADHEQYLQHLLEFDREQRELVQRSQQLINFIDERVLWVPSGGVLDFTHLQEAGQTIRWTVEPTYLQQLLRAGQERLRSRPLTSVALLLILLFFAALLRPMQRQLARWAKRQRETEAPKPVLVLQTLVLTLAHATTPPLLLLWAAHSLGASPEATLYVRSITDGLSAAAWTWLTVRLAADLLASDGLAEIHGGWPQEACLRLRRQLRWLSPVLFLSAFFIFMCEGRADEQARESLGRLTIVGASLALALFGHAVLRPAGAMWPMLVERRRLLPQAFLHRALHGFAVGGPAVMMLAALAGYTWTVLQLLTRLHFTLLLCLALLLFSDLLQRWLRHAQQRVVQAHTTAQQAAEAPHGASPGALSPNDAAVIGSPSRNPSLHSVLDMATMSNHAQHFIRLSLLALGLLGLFTIWADLLPAVGVLRNVELWRTTQEVVATVPRPDGTEAQITEARKIPVTLADAATALLLAGLSWMLIRNLPGMIEVTLFRRLHAGERYAYSTIIKYTIGLAGATLSLDALGASWSSIQWLVAAVGLGLGFGLQEIFANFISGLIILFERPVRVGDMVTVGDISGTVSRIHIRATWITRFDRKELIVPNRELVTNRLINWSLSDSILRVTVAVGIAYGSDTERAVDVLHRVARDNPKVLSDPKPQVLFLRFEDSALGFELRAFTGNASESLGLRHELHMAVHQALREAGIEIAFPQRDLHLYYANGASSQLTQKDSAAFSGENGQPVAASSIDP